MKTSPDQVCPHQHSSRQLQWEPLGPRRLTTGLPLDSPVSQFLRQHEAVHQISPEDLVQRCLVPQANVFRRMLLKSSRGQVLEDIDNYDTLCRIFQNMKSEAILKGEAASSKDIRRSTSRRTSQHDERHGQNVRHHLMSGILGDHQEFLVQFRARRRSGFAFQLVS